MDVTNASGVGKDPVEPFAVEIGFDSETEVDRLEVAVLVDIGESVGPEFPEIIMAPSLASYLEDPWRGVGGDESVPRL